MFLVFFLFALFALIFPLGIMSTHYCGPIFFTAVRMMLAGSIILVYQYRKDRSVFVIKRQNLIPLFKLTLFNIYLTNVLEFWGLQFLTSAKASFIYNFSPIISAILSYFYFGERMTTKKWFALGAGFMGFLPMLLHQSPGEVSLNHVFFLSGAELALLGAAAATVLGWISMRRLVQQNFNSMLANGVSMFVGGVMALLTSPFSEPWHPLPVYNLQWFLILLLVIMITSNFICYNLYGFLLRKYTATFMSFVGLCSPFFAAAYGWVLLGERVSWQFLVSSITVLASLYLFYHEELKQGYILREKKQRRFLNFF